MVQALRTINRRPADLEIDMPPLAFAKGDFFTPRRMLGVGRVKPDRYHLIVW